MKNKTKCDYTSKTMIKRNKIKTKDSPLRVLRRMGVAVSYRDDESNLDVFLGNIPGELRPKILEYAKENKADIIKELEEETGVYGTVRVRNCNIADATFVPDWGQLFVTGVVMGGGGGEGADYCVAAERYDGDATRTVINIGARQGNLSGGIHIELYGGFERCEFVKAIEAIARHLRDFEDPDWQDETEMRGV